MFIVRDHKLNTFCDKKKKTSIHNPSKVATIKAVCVLISSENTLKHLSNLGGNEVVVPIGKFE